MEYANFLGLTSQKHGHIRKNTCNRDLWAAASSGSLYDVDIALALLKKSNSSIDAKNAFGSTALHIATWRNHVPIVRKLLSAGADLDIRDGESGWTSLHRALHFGHLAVAGVLIEAGASLIIEDTKGRTAIDLVSGPVQQAITNSKKGGATEILGWGNGSNYQLGTGAAGIQRIPCRIDALQGLDVIAVAAAKFHSVALTEKGELFSWGFGRGGRLGHPDFDIHSGQVAVITPRRVMCGIGFQRVKSIAVAKHHSIVSIDGGEVYSWGSNREGQLGYPSVDTQAIPRRVSALKSRVVAVAAANKHSAVVTEGGDIYSWGCNREGQLGYGTSNSASNYTPHSVDYLKGKKLVAVSAAKYHTVVLGAEGEVFTWGYKMVTPRRVIIARNTKKAGSLPLKFHRVERLHILTIAAGMTHSTALSEDGLIFYWMSADPNLRCSQLLSMAGHQAVAVAAGKYRTAVITALGSVYVWDGEKCAGDTAPLPVRIHGIKHATHLSVGDMHSLVVASLYVPSFPPKAVREPSVSTVVPSDQDNETEESLEADDAVSGVEILTVQELGSPILSKCTPSLKDLCQKVVAHCIVEPKNVVQLLEIADSLGADDLRRYCEDLILHNLDYILTISASTFGHVRPSLLADLEISWDVSSAQSWSHRRLPMPSATLPAVIDSAEDNNEVCLGTRARSLTCAYSSNMSCSGKSSYEGFFQDCPSGDDTLMKQIRATRKKLQQIDVLEMKQAKGHSLDDQQLAKLRTKIHLLERLMSLESGVIPKERKMGENVGKDDLESRNQIFNDMQKGKNESGKQHRRLSRKKSKTLVELDQGLDEQNMGRNNPTGRIVSTNKPGITEKYETTESVCQGGHNLKTSKETENSMHSYDECIKIANPKISSLPKLHSGSTPMQSEISKSATGFVIASSDVLKIPSIQIPSHSVKKKGKTGGLSSFLRGALDARPELPVQIPNTTKKEGLAWGGVQVQKGPASLRDIQTQQTAEAGRQKPDATIKQLQGDVFPSAHSEMEQTEDVPSGKRISLSSLVRSAPIAVTPAKSSSLNPEQSPPPWAGLSPGTSAPSLRDIQMQQVKNKAQQRQLSSFGSPKTGSPLSSLTLSTGCSNLTADVASTTDSSNRWFKPDMASPSSIRCIQIEEEAMKELRRLYKDVKLVKNVQ
ncbi:hypothetical protein O6H91_11G107500 [Diphasiastrum complanatum]|uniref:Uncharacterized protein n=11 Tax=Diphasiastrum complanatum TaxID=34168 RepID=A0ACC2CCQ8_DIPCM|nr:hypothetical protein O6H91_11G107500 [Diphasiastrum complanatum]KAJ7539742.1 hypothetical protein O6H91_11G107500 [Diphasiastrum complanatum]KAJ7539743.1 hypothetical protein O6H91_11G107500 [Diphasiastrum complanatum]KAJ7539744.1 hypothetical protein O6H91_11G107500 [Diphasiastrum complanatum]KAJ7539745.1 hypothetical protein O6H91_11G107500 [Diphasiastrum complanatum]